MRCGGDVVFRSAKRPPPRKTTRTLRMMAAPTPGISDLPAYVANACSACRRPAQSKRLSSGVRPRRTGRRRADRRADFESTMRMPSSEYLCQLFLILCDDI